MSEVWSLAVLLVFLFLQFAHGAVHLSDLPANEGQLEAISSANLEFGKMGVGDPSSVSPRGSRFDELLPYVMPSPDQEDAGSCLYMALTGIAEWWLAKLHPGQSRQSDGPLDLSERYLMNLAGMDEDDAGLANWKTDSIFLFNRAGKRALLNSKYRYTKGWYLGESYSDKIAPSREGVPGAEYGTIFNWIDQRPAPELSQVEPQASAGWANLPSFDRHILFADGSGNQWNVGVAPENIVDKVKTTLRMWHAPVLVIYNHNSYWHAVYVVGYDDEADNGQCAYTERFRSRILERARELDQKAREATDPKVKAAYEIRAKRAFEAKDKIERAYASKGGCSSGKGVFYIRDSIYPDAGGPLYHYDPARRSADRPYAKKIVTKEYDWLRYFANHVTVILPKDTP